jgi:hypothetical protein
MPILPVPCALFSNLKLYPFTPFCKQATSKQEGACKGECDY